MLGLLTPGAPQGCISALACVTYARPQRSTWMMPRQTRSGASSKRRLTPSARSFGTRSGPMNNAASSAGLSYYRRLFGPASRPRGELDPESLPQPDGYLRERGMLTRRVHGEWVSVRCPAHKNGDEVHPSLRVSLRDGHFKCHACGASGGDIVALHRLATGLGFREAMRDLGGRFYD